LLQVSGSHSDPQSRVIIYSERRRRNLPSLSFANKSQLTSGQSYRISVPG
jgi:hypothetical protein